MNINFFVNDMNQITYYIQEFQKHVDFSAEHFDQVDYLFVFSDEIKTLYEYV